LKLATGVSPHSIPRQAQDHTDMRRCGIWPSQNAQSANFRPKRHRTFLINLFFKEVVSFRDICPKIMTIGVGSDSCSINITRSVIPS